jgi:hypothetical protein
LTDAGNDRECGHDDFVATADAESLNRGIEGCGAIANRNPVVTADSFREQFFECGDEWAFRGDPAGIDTLS